MLAVNKPCEDAMRATLRDRLRGSADTKTLIREFRGRITRELRAGDAARPEGWNDRSAFIKKRKARSERRARIARNLRARGIHGHRRLRRRLNQRSVVTRKEKFVKSFGIVILFASLKDPKRRETFGDVYN